MTNIDKINNKKELSPEQRQELVSTLKVRFDKNMNRHIEVEWDKVQEKLENDSESLWSLYEMEKQAVNRM